MKIGIIGAGRVGFTIGKYLKQKELPDIRIAGYYSRSRESADSAATFTGTESFSDIKALVENCDTLFITTPDGVITNVWNVIKDYNIQDMIICHFSGSLSSDVFSGIEETGAKGLSIHPMYAFSDRLTSYEKFNTACLTFEGNQEAKDVFMGIFRDKLGHKIFSVSSEDKIKYHAAAAFASNYVVGIMSIAKRLLAECGFDDEDAMTLLAPIARGNLNSVIGCGVEKALTGPIDRCDVDTVKKHMQVLDGTDSLEVYKSLGRELVKIASEKNRDREYGELTAILGTGKEI